ncbi:hypothetical protein JX265_011571 [Neoarthrinium moseri]|uniref:Uncharacterized protein n=1 Tax=Neoarthrinium moseri TaxID=1658444 RepID=A0A9P9WCJ0_9PEZI|nr:uncharacterized protein JN550_011679 [Neoarthrinium moseri]KAI1848575.1 hypothetical protein JX266_005434 [Neoarthrinium moseri]KAI1856612.1 hypothetical protein JX265_011571 [Neoarthrinium moseri]KAI1859995.1 hypothetical protein JN550_011679 [Neoarthrinium moseri]
MRKPTKASNSTSSSAADDAVSLHTNPGETEAFPLLHDDDAPELNLDSLDDLPPVYSDAVDSPPSAARSAPYPAFRKDANTGAEVYLRDELQQPAALESFIRSVATIPPRPYLRVVGTHTASRKKSDGKTEKKTVTDFAVSVEMTPYLYSAAQYGRSWTQLRTVDNAEKVRRGTSLKKRAPGSQQDIEVGGGPKPSLEEWCHRYCASHTGLRCFALKREMTGFDFLRVKEQLHALVRSTNYRGRLDVHMVTNDATVEVYNDARINRWRFTSWIQWLFYLTLMFIFSWPYLFFRTKRWEVAVAEWPFSRMAANGQREYVSISEDQLYNMWGRAVLRAVLEKRQCVLDQADLARAQEPDPSFESGHSAVDGAINLFRAGIGAMNEVNRQLGWGADEF